MKNKKKYYIYPNPESPWAIECSKGRYYIQHVVIILFILACFGTAILYCILEKGIE